MSNKLGAAYPYPDMSLVRDENDAPLLFHLPGPDISARKSTEAALFAEQERARVTLNSIGDAVLTTDMAGNITYLNVVAEKMTGWSREEAAGRPLARYSHPRRPAPASRRGVRGVRPRGNKTVGMSPASY